MEKQLITKQAVYEVLRRYWKEYKVNPLHTILAFFLPTAGTILVFFVPPLIVGKIINILAARGEGLWHDIGFYVALLGGLWFLGEVCWRIGIHYMIKFESRSINSLSKSMFDTLAVRDYNFYANNFVGSVVKKGMAFARQFDTFTETLAYNVITNIFPIIFAMYILWHYSPWIPIVLLFWICVTISIAVPIIKGRSKLVAARHDAGSKMSGRFSDAMSNMIAVKSFAQEEKESTIFGQYVDTYTQSYKKSYDYQNLRFETVISPIFVITNVFGLLMSVFFTIKLNLPIGTTMVVFSYYSQISRIFWDINRVYRGIESSISEAAEFTQLTLGEPEIKDKEHAERLDVAESVITFKDVNFAYERGEDEGMFLSNFNLEIKGNQKVGLIGPSGGGKTTITKLLLRFVDINSGAITVDGQDIRNVTQNSLRQAIAYVPQEPLLFHRTLLENIAYADTSATQEEVVEAAKLAHAHEFIMELPHGYDTLVGERGIKLSGGQRQRVAIARALLKKAPIIVLDEATSSLDSESEKYIQDGLLELMKNKTAVVIAHRLSTIKHLDRIIVLEQGKIVQDGTHDELIKQKGLYAKLWSHQSGEILED